MSDTEVKMSDPIDGESPAEDEVAVVEEAPKGAKATGRAIPRLDLSWQNRATRITVEPRRVLIGLVGVAVLLLLAAGYLARVNSADNDLETARTDALQAGSSAIATILSYDYRDVDEAVAERSDLVTGGFGEKYAKLVTDQVAPAAKKQKVVTRTEVASAAVVDATNNRVNLLIFVNQVSAQEGSDVPVLSGSRIRVEMTFLDGTWRVSDVTPV